MYRKSPACAVLPFPPQRNCGLRCSRPSATKSVSVAARMPYIEFSINTGLYGHDLVGLSRRLGADLVRGDSLRQAAPSPRRQWSIARCCACAPLHSAHHDGARFARTSFGQSSVRMPAMSARRGVAVCARGGMTRSRCRSAQITVDSTLSTVAPRRWPGSRTKVRVVAKYSCWRRGRRAGPHDAAKRRPSASRPAANSMTSP